MSTGFKSSNDFSLHIEKLKATMSFETYTETVLYYYEHHSDHEVEDIVKMLNRNIREMIEQETIDRGLIKVDRVTFE